jgi:hypothetical protein
MDLQPGQFLAIAGAFLGGGIVVGIRRQLRSDKFILSFRAHATPITVASKALLFGTFLCLGGFFGTVGSIAIITGNYSLSQCEESMKKLLKPLKRNRPIETEPDVDLSELMKYFDEVSKKDKE